ncbi:hypothetical protein C5167_017479 [Papaver somniferum]|uniref:B box-type domain-containing protein n=1 Tax=Papaver somniferum TaxID=3469 RepID=A0A4Y7IJJ2_PAPSO|nr:B-box zinc finger protein 23-like [Papaver somniferum]RZC49054.1 hypothetical protein C5167_017479 [Papaver somniferum]
MKIQCDVCEKAEAVVLCCADEAALCYNCDVKVHAANKLASKHQRIPLLHNNHNRNQPSCDICQEKAGYFFCLEDRALLCRNCDVSIHSSTRSSHQRFLLTGVKLNDFQQQQQQITDSKPSSLSYLNSSMTPNNANGSSSLNISSTNIDMNSNSTFSDMNNNSTFSSDPHFSDWRSDEIFTNSTNLDQNYEFSPSEFESSTISSS